MMKYIVCLFIVASFSTIAKAQKPVLSKDDKGKFIYYEVVQQNQTSKDSLAIRQTEFFKTYKALKLTQTNGDTSFVYTGKNVINKTLLVMSHPSGEILYNLTVEIKEGKYRFWFTDFSFIPYYRDRYSNFVPSTTVGKPLEENPGKLNAGQWKEYQTQTAVNCKEFADRFKKQMAHVEPQLVKQEVKQVKKEW